jgi:hypothetical protein
MVRALNRRFPRLFRERIGGRRRALMRTISSHLSRIGKLPTCYRRAVDLAALDRLINTYPFQARALLEERDRRVATRLEERR